MRHNAACYGFVLPLKMVDERHHWEFIGVEAAQKLNTYIAFDLSRISDEEGAQATAPQKDESFSLRVNSSDELYMKKEKD